jgi:hypothetical protein
MLGASLFGFSNQAPGSTPSQSLPLANPAMPDASKPIDGNLANAFGGRLTIHTAPGAGVPVFWEITLASVSSINEICPR